MHLQSIGVHYLVVPYQNFWNVVTNKLESANLTLIPSQVMIVDSEPHKTLTFIHKTKLDPFRDCFNVLEIYHYPFFFVSAWMLVFLLFGQYSI